LFGGTGKRMCRLRMYFNAEIPENPAVKVSLRFCRENMFVREILKAKLPEPGGESRWKPRETGRNDLDAATGDT